MMSRCLLSGILIFFSIIQTSGRMYRVRSTNAEYENLTEKLELNVSVSKATGLTVYVNVVQDLYELFTDVSLIVDINENNDYSFDVVNRTINTCKLFKDPLYEPVVQFLYKLLLKSGNFPTECPIRKGLYYIKDMKTDPKFLPQQMSGKKAILTIKHLSNESKKLKLMAYYKVFFAVESVHTISNETISSNASSTKTRKANRRRH